MTNSHKKFWLIDCENVEIWWNCKGNLWKVYKEENIFWKFWKNYASNLSSSQVKFYRDLNYIFGKTCKNFRKIFGNECCKNFKKIFLEKISNKILGIFGKNFENFWENLPLIIIKLIQFQYNLLKFWVDFKKIFSKFEKTQMQKS